MESSENTTHNNDQPNVAGPLKIFFYSLGHITFAIIGSVIGLTIAMAILLGDLQSIKIFFDTMTSQKEMLKLLTEHLLLFVLVSNATTITGALIGFMLSFRITVFALNREKIIDLSKFILEIFVTIFVLFSLLVLYTTQLSGGEYLTSFNNWVTSAAIILTSSLISISILERYNFLSTFFIKKSDK